MKTYTNVHSFDRPQEIEMTNSQVLLAANIKKLEETVDDQVREYYEYDYTIYSKDEFIALLASQKGEIEELKDELQAAKILLGVE